MKLTELAAAFGAEVRNLREDFEIRAITTLERAQPGDVSFVSSDKYLPGASSTRASAIIIPASLDASAATAAKLKSLPETAAIVPVAEPWAAVIMLLQQLSPGANAPDFCSEPGCIHPSAVIDVTAQIAPDACVGPQAVIGPRVQIGARVAIGSGATIGRDCTIGEDTTIHAGVVIQAGTVVGRRVIIHPNAVIGADGFKYETIGGKLTKIPQTGIVVIEDDVELGANTCVDRAGFTETVIGTGTKMDNLVQIGHNVRIGRDVIIVAQSAVGGSCEIGDGTILAGQTGVADNLKIGKNVTALARSAIMHNVPDKERVFGVPAQPFRQEARTHKAMQRVPELLKEFDRLKERVEKLERELAERDRLPSAKTD